MKSSLATTLIILQILTLGAVVGMQMQTQRSAKNTVDRLEQIKDSLAGSLTRQSDFMVRLKTAIEEVGRLQDQVRHDGGTRDDAHVESAPADAPGEIPATADQHLRKLLTAFQERRSAQLAGTELESTKSMFDQLEATFVARGPAALQLLPEEMRANRDEETRRYLLGELLPKFTSIDQKGCFLAARKVLLDAAASAPLRKLAARQAIAFDKDAALNDIRDMLGKAGQAAVELRVELLDVLKEHPDPQLEDAVCHLAGDRQFGPRIQTAAIRLLGAYQTPKAIATLKQIVDGDTPNAQCEALEALTHIMKKDAVAYLEEVAARDPKTVPDVVRDKAKNLIDTVK